MLDRYLAAFHHLPEEDYERLSVSVLTVVREKLGANTTSPIHILERLATDRDSSVFKAVANNPSTPDWLVQNILYKNRMMHGDFAAKHPAVTVELLREIASTSNQRFKIAVLANPKAPVDVVESCVLETDVLVCQAALRSWNLPTKYIDEALADSRVWVRVAVAGSPILSVDQSTILAKDESILVLSALMGNEHVAHRAHEDARAKFATQIAPRLGKSGPSVPAQVDFIMNNVITQAMYDQSVMSRSTTVRVAALLKAYDQGLISLSKAALALKHEKSRHKVWFDLLPLIDSTRVVRLMFTMQEATYAGHIDRGWTQDRELVEDLVNSLSPLYVWPVIQYVKLDADLLQMIAPTKRFGFSGAIPEGLDSAASSAFVNDARQFAPDIFVIRHPLTRVQTWRTLARPGSKLVTAAIVTRVEAHELDRFARYKAWEVRKEVALREDAPYELLRQLAIDEDLSVRKAVLNNPSATPDIKVLASLSS